MEQRNVKKRIYLDHASTTPADKRVFKAMEPFFSKNFANPGSIHREGVHAKNVVMAARNKVADILGAHPDEIIFTSGGTEANNLAIQGIVDALVDKKMHIITSVIEHASVLDMCKHLEERGVSVSYMPVDARGIVDVKKLSAALTKKTALVSVMYANNEIGTIQPVSEISKAIRNFRKNQEFPASPSEAGQVRIGNQKRTNAAPVFHCDASQVPAYLDINVQKLGVDLMTLDGQKIYGPKGVGMLYKKRGITLSPMMRGGNQEFGLRAGTENVPGIVGFAEALALVVATRQKETKRLTILRDYFIKEALRRIKGAELNGDPRIRLANNVNISFLGRDPENKFVVGVESDWLMLQLDARGIAVGSKSACLLGDEGGSYVVSALGKSDTHSKSSIRFTFGKNTTKKDIDYTVNTLVEITKHTP